MSGEGLRITIRRFPELDSTNTWAVAHCAELEEGDLIWADRQTAGRGRHDRSWLAVPAKSLTLSLVLKRPEWIPLGPNLGQVAALALITLLERYGIRGQVKWPNDVMVDDRKIAGILVERTDDNSFVIGLGLNVNVSYEDFRTSGLDRPVTSLSEVLSKSLEMEPVFADLAGALKHHFDQAREEGLAPLWRLWARHDWLKDRCVKILDVNGEVEVGDYLGTSPEGGLRLRTLEGYEKVFWSGDVERVTC